MTKAISRAINPHIAKFLKNNPDARQDKMLKDMVHDWISLTKEKKRKVAKEKKRKGHPKEKKRKVAKEKKRKVAKEKKRKKLGTVSRKNSIWITLDKNTLEIEYLKTRVERLEKKNSKYRKLIDWLSN